MSDKFFFSFVHAGNDGNWSFDRNYEYGTSWDVVLQDFLQYLSGIYGYDISQKVSYETLEERVHNWLESHDEQPE